MKLYATITSERASKGQGGNWLKIDIMDKQRKTAAELSIDEDDGIITITLDGYDPECVGFVQFPRKQFPKGEQQECYACKIAEIDLGKGRTCGTHTKGKQQKGDRKPCIHGRIDCQYCED